MLGLYAEEIEPILEEIDIQIEIDSLAIEKAVFELANLHFDGKGTQRRKVQKHIKSRIAALNSKINKHRRRSWLIT